MPSSHQPIVAAEARPPIERRKMRFGFEQVEDPLWFRDNVLLTTFFATLSASFPPGEREFVRSVLNYRKQLSGELLEQVSDFASQEGHHARQHDLASEWLDRLGFDASARTKAIEAELDAITRDAPHELRLAYTVCSEHMTAIMAHHALTQPGFFDGVAGPVAALLRWHAVEEIEHKAVAFDVYERCVGDRARLRKVLRTQTLIFCGIIVRHQAQMLQGLDREPSVAEWLEFLAFLFGPGGLVPGILGRYLDFFAPGFHPWQHDDRALVEQWRSTWEQQARAA